jgi:hypothetical protein
MRRDTERTVRMAEGGVRFALEKSTEELRDKQVFPVDPEHVARVAVKTKTNEWVLAKQGDGTWVIATPTSAPQLADTTQVVALLGSLRAEQVLKFLPDPAGRGDADFEHPLVEAQLMLDTGEKVQMRVSQSQWDAGPSYVVLREDSQGGFLARVQFTLLGRFDRNAKDLLDHSMLRVKKDQVTRMIFHGGAGPDLVVEKPAADAGAESWHLVSPRVAPVKVFKVTSALWQLTGLKSASVVEEKPKDPTKYGLDVTAKFVALVGSDGHELGRLVLGKEVPGKPSTVYALGTSGDVMELELGRLSELPWKP